MFGHHKYSGWTLFDHRRGVSQTGGGQYIKILINIQNMTCQVEHERMNNLFFLKTKRNQRTYMNIYTVLLESPLR